MPLYSYRCGACDHTFDEFHSIKEVRTDCCECKTERSLQRIIQEFLNLKKLDAERKEAGSLVKNCIEETKREMNEEKEKLSKQEYNP
jgi:putative FmdB family regulatory protein